jgi:hypothetical protein
MNSVSGSRLLESNGLCLAPDNLNDRTRKIIFPLPRSTHGMAQSDQLFSPPDATCDRYRACLWIHQIEAKQREGQYCSLYLTNEIS